MDAIFAALFWNTVLLAALFVAQALLRIQGMGWSYALSNFDDRRTETVLARRVALARSNQIETLVLWGLTVLAIGLAAPDYTHPHLSAVGAVLVVVRLAYVAVTLGGVPVARSAVWAVGLAAWGYFAWLAAPALSAS